MIRKTFHTIYPRDPINCVILAKTNILKYRLSWNSQNAIVNTYSHHNNPQPPVYSDNEKYNNIALSKSINPIQVQKLKILLSFNFHHTLYQHKTFFTTKTFHLVFTPSIRWLAIRLMDYGNEAWRLYEVQSDEKDDDDDIM